MKRPVNTRQSSPAPSLITVAREAGVSTATVSRIVNGETRRASAKTIKRVEATVAQLGYKPNSVGRALRRGQSRVVAMLAPNLDNPAMAAIAVSTETALREAGYVMILCDTHDRADLQDEYLHAMRAQVVQGYVMVSAVESPALREAVTRGEPIVFVGRRNPGGDGVYIGIDNHAAGATAADYCLAKGISDPAVIFPAQASSSARQRADGFIDRLVALGIPDARIVRACAPGLSHLEVGYDATRILISELGAWPNSLFCVSDMMAYGAYRLAIEQGVRVPEHCLLIGIDGNPINSWIAPWLTSVHIPYSDFGSKVVLRLEDLWGGFAPGDCIIKHWLNA